MSEGIVVCSKCGAIVVQIIVGNIAEEKAKHQWIHLHDKKPICKDAIAKYPDGLCEHGFADWCPRGCYAGQRGR